MTTSKPFADDVPQQDNALGVLHPIDPAEAAAARRTVAGRAVDAADLALLLDVLGIASPEPTPEPVQPRASAPLAIDHGTTRGYEQHRFRYDMPPCGPCREAAAAYRRARKAARKAGGAT